MQSRQLSPRWNRTTKITVAVFLLIAVGIALYVVRFALIPVIVAAIIAYILHPPARGLSELTRMPHGLATALIYLLMLAVVIPLVLSLVPRGVVHFEAIVDAVVQLIDSLQQLSPDATLTILNFELNVTEVLEQATEPLITALRTVAGGTIGLVLGAAQTVLMTVFTLIIGFYFTRDGERFIEGFVASVPDDYRSEIAHLVEQIDLIWQSYFREQLFSALITMFVVAFLATLVGLPQPILMGILAGLLQYLPGVGSYLWLIVALILAFTAGSTRLEVSNLVFVLIVIAIQVFYTQGLRRLLQGLFTYRDVTLHPVVLIVGVLAGFVILGLLGVILAAPLMATVVSILRYIYAKLTDQKPFNNKSLLMETSIQMQAVLPEPVPSGSQADG